MEEKLSPARALGRKIGTALLGTLHGFLRPLVVQILEELSVEPPCEAEDDPDCQNCDQHGHCLQEPGVAYEAPPGYVLVRRGPPPHPWSVN